MVTLTGTNITETSTGADTLIGTAEDDVIAGLSGNDLIEGLEGNDFLSGGFDRDTVLGGAGDDRVLHSGGDIGDFDVLDGGEGFDRLIIERQAYPALFSIVNTDFRNFERIDLNENPLLITTAQMAGIQQVTGFGSTGVLRTYSPGTLDLGSIVVGEDGTGIGRIESHADVQTDFTWDASGATAAWEMTNGTRNNHALMIGGAGNDTLRGRDGDTLRGGAGDDTFSLIQSTGSSFSLIDGGEGRDTIEGNQVIYLRRADFSLTQFDNVEVFSGSGILRAAGLNGFDSFENVGVLEMATPGTVDLSGRITSTSRTVFGTGAAFFEFVGSEGPDNLIWTDTRFRVLLDAGQGHDTVTTGDGNDNVRGNGGNDVIHSGDGADIITGGEGNDTIIAWGSEADAGDRVEGGNGSDSIEGGAGNDALAGDSFFDFNRSAGNDTIDGGDGADRIIGSGGDDLLIGGTSDADLADVIFGNNGHDSIYGGAGNDSVNGGDGNDTIYGGVGSDTLLGNSGDDLITGGALSDLIFGNDGNDFINGGFGSDRLNGGAGADLFFHAVVAGHGSDWIQDFATEDALVAADGLQRADFQVNIATTAGAGSADVAEAFVIYRPTGQILWALVDGAGLGTLTLMIDETPYELLA